MSRIAPTKKEFKPLPLFDEEGRPMLYLVKIFDAKVEPSPFDKTGEKEVVNVEYNVLDEGLTDRKIWTLYNFMVSRPKAKRTSKLTELIKAADPNYKQGEEYETNDLKGKVLRIQLKNTNKSADESDTDRIQNPLKDDEVYQKADLHFAVKKPKGAAADAPVAEEKPVEAGIAGVELPY